MKRLILLTLLTMAGLLLLVPAGAQAQSTNCADPVQIPPDGSVFQEVLASGAEIWYEMSARANASYTFEMWQDRETNAGDVEVFRFADFVTATCTGTPAPGRVNIDTIDPALGNEGDRVAWTATATEFFFLRVTNNGPSTSTVHIMLTETSLFSPRWSTFGGFYTTWGFYNTTRTNISVTLRVVAAGVNCFTGSPLATATFSVVAGSVTFRDTRVSDLNIAANQAGAVCVTYLGPHGGILADGFMTNEGGTVFVTIPVKFEPTRQTLH